MVECARGIADVIPDESTHALTCTHSADTRLLVNFDNNQITGRRQFARSFFSLISRASDCPRLRRARLITPYQLLLFFARSLTEEHRRPLMPDSHVYRAWIFGSFTRSASVGIYPASEPYIFRRFYHLSRRYRWKNTRLFRARAFNNYRPRWARSPHREIVNVTARRAVVAVQSRQ